MIQRVNAILAELRSILQNAVEDGDGETILSIDSGFKDLLLSELPAAACYQVDFSYVDGCHCHTSTTYESLTSETVDGLALQVAHHSFRDDIDMDAIQLRVKLNGAEIDVYRAALAKYILVADAAEKRRRVQAVDEAEKNELRTKIGAAQDELNKMRAELTQESVRKREAAIEALVKKLAAMS